MRKNVKNVIDAFAASVSCGSFGDSISTDGDSIFSYHTCLFTIGGGHTIFNGSHYSNTTSQQQSAIRAELANVRTITVTELGRGATAGDLIKAAAAL
jgi:hypothetical protein